MEEIFVRRSIREFSNKKVESNKVEEILRAGMQAPTAGNQRAYKFVVIENKEVLKKLSNLSLYAAPIEKCSVAIVVLKDENVARFPENLEQDLGAVVENMLLEAVYLELGAVWLGVSPLSERMDFVVDVLKLQKGEVPYCVIPIGYPGENQSNRFIDRYDEKKIRYIK
ncbi:MAG: nitroreductase family protein [Fusobacterium sp. JB019]|nr:nitroreductase family protein [Fusobacterium sp. JB019]